jgi:hypothetical protein
VPWFLVITLAITVSMRINAFEVSKFASYNKERAMESQIQSIEAERKRQEKMIARLKSIEADEHDAHEAHDAAGEAAVGAGK